ncbi:hypothetical protein K435DRAFT_848972 [Dendrothele bispora CBS 962.96]|uniref:Uncharacterized protein n=1 Tax=Dendrothele bispora (strain CBS 962.96) TaxID=1314807 RepID=A0A4S8MTF2_DENBC|nr:hypothetical protein K435DRAFT_848972 [Dendrothele bispora CBS 962.96]
MSPYNYQPPSSPTYGFFPTGVTSPNAFASFHQCPRDTHAMYAAAFPSSSSYSPSTNGGQQPTHGIQNPLKKCRSSHPLHVNFTQLVYDTPYAFTLLGFRSSPTSSAK